MKVIDTYEIHNKMLGITLDNAANNNSMIQELDADGSSFRSFHHIRCFAHVMNLGAQAALNVLAEDLEIQVTPPSNSPLSNSFSEFA